MIKKYELTPEHRAELAPWAAKWTRIIMSTEPMTEADSEASRVAVVGLYAAANLPPPKHIIFVSSPMVLAFAGGFAAAIWYRRKCDAATSAATRAATRAATGASDDESMHRNWYTDIAPTMAILAREIGGDDARFFLACAANRYSMWNGGNQWGQWVSYLSFLRHIARLDLDYSRWEHYEVLATVSGPRIMHPEFCMISDRPDVLTVDDANRPHNDTGPFCRWRDGTALYSVHGVRVPGWIVEHPESITVSSIEAEQNEEIRRIMVDRYGLARYVRDAQFDVIDADLDPLGNSRRLLRRGAVVVIELTNSTVDADGARRMYHIACEPELRPLLENGDMGEPQELSALNAVASTYGMRGDEYVLSVET